MFHRTTERKPVQDRLVAILRPPWNLLR
jgi:hypothetical protein